MVTALSNLLCYTGVTPRVAMRICLTLAVLASLVTLVGCEDGGDGGGGD